MDSTWTLKIHSRPLTLHTHAWRRECGETTKRNKADATGLLSSNKIRTSELEKIGKVWCVNAAVYFSSQIILSSCKGKRADWAQLSGSSKLHCCVLSHAVRKNSDNHFCTFMSALHRRGKTLIIWLHLPAAIIWRFMLSPKLEFWAQVVALVDQFVRLTCEEKHSICQKVGWDARQVQENMTRRH